MKILTIEGGRPLTGCVRVSGAKNAVLPLLAATAAHGGRYRLENCPALSDVDATVDILEHLGCRVYRNADVIEVDSRPMFQKTYTVSFILSQLFLDSQRIRVYPFQCNLRHMSQNTSITF